MSDFLTPAHEQVMEAAEEARERREKEVVHCPECNTEILKDSIEDALDTADTHDEKRHDGKRVTKVNGILPPQFSEEEKSQIQEEVQAFTENATNGEGPKGEKMSSETQQVIVGRCPDHGYVTEDGVDYNFPNPTRCECGLKLIDVTLPDQQRVQELAGENTTAAGGSE